MPVLVWVALGALGMKIIDDQLEDAFGGAPSPFSIGGAAVWGLAGFGAFELAKRAKLF